MTPTLEPPRPTEQSQTEPSDDQIEPFPYRGASDGSPLRTATRPLVLRSRDGATEGTPGSIDCPRCGTDVVNGAGLFACSDCDWTGRLD